MVACHPGDPGAHAHCPVEVSDWKLAPGAALSLLQPTGGEIARGHARKPPTARPLTAQVQRGSLLYVMDATATVTVVAVREIGLGL